MKNIKYGMEKSGMKNETGDGSKYLSPVSFDIKGYKRKAITTGYGMTGYHTGYILE